MPKPRASAKARLVARSTLNMGGVYIFKVDRKGAARSLNRVSWRKSRGRRSGGRGVILSADIRPHRKLAAAAEQDNESCSIDHGAGYKAMPVCRQGQTERQSHSTIFSITSPNRSKAADQTKAEAKLAN